MPTLTEHIRSIRNHLNYSQDAMADELGISQTAYSYLENNNEDNLTIGRLKSIASIFKMDFVELVAKSSGIKIKRVSLNQQGGSTNGVVIHSTALLNSPRTINARIRQYRETIGLTQEQMSIRMGVSKKTYSKLETSEEDHITIGKLKQVAMCLELSHWTELISIGNVVSIEVISENQHDGLTNGIIFETEESLHQRVQYLEKVITEILRDKK
jgi:transcriptional regulator with XRE-family HTH domain